jgi:hypothetical protein
MRWHNGTGDWSKEVVLDASTKPLEFIVTTMYMEHNANPAEPALTGAHPVVRTPSLTPAQHVPPLMPQVAEFTSLSSTEPDLDANHDEQVSLRFHRIDNILGPAAVPGLAERTFLKELHAISVEEP